MKREVYWIIRFVLVTNATTLCLLGLIFNLSLSVSFFGMSLLFASFAVWSYQKYQVPQDNGKELK